MHQPQRRQGNRVLFGIAILVFLGGWPFVFNHLTGAGEATAGPRSPVQFAASPALFAAAGTGDTPSIADVAERSVESVVAIHTAVGYRGGGAGSGVIVSDDGIVVTNHHVVARARKILVTLADGREFAAKVVGTDRKTDLAVLQIAAAPSGLHAIRLGDSSKVRLGEVVLAIGNPLDVGQTVTMGIVSAKGRTNGTAMYSNFIQTDAAINRGNSGGALVNMKGELIGINQSIASSGGGYDGIGFAIPSNMADPIIRSLLKEGRVHQAWLGVSIRTVDQALVRELGLDVHAGVLVVEVVGGSPADLAGLRPGDVIQQVRGEEVSTANQLTSLVATAGVDSSIEIKAVRGSKERSFEAKLTGREPRQRRRR